MFGGWVDNGDGSYTSGGAADDTLRWDGIGVIAGQSYQVDYRVSGGSVSLKLNGGSAHPVTGSGSLLLDDATSDGVQFVSLTGEITTVHRLSVRRVLPEYGPELWSNASAFGMGGVATQQPDGSFNITADEAGIVGIRSNVPANTFDGTKKYEVDFAWSGNTAGNNVGLFVGSSNTVSSSASGSQKLVVTGGTVSQSIQLYVSGATIGEAYNFHIRSVREVL